MISKNIFPRKQKAEPAYYYKELEARCVLGDKATT